jgi:hypothetical protein
LLPRSIDENLAGGSPNDTPLIVERQGSVALARVPRSGVAW